MNHIDGAVSGPHINKFGINTDVDAAEDIAIIGGNVTFPTAAAATNIISSSVNDAAAGTGAQSVRVEGLDTNHQIISEDAIPNGTTLVALTQEFLHVFRAYNLTAGSGGVNAGNIDVRHTTTVLARIGALDGQTLQATYSVPALDTDGSAFRGAFVHSWHVSAARVAAGFARVALQTREDGAAWRTQEIVSISANGAGPLVLGFDAPLFVPTMADIRVRAIDVSAANTEVSSGFHLQLWRTGPGVER